MEYRALTFDKLCLEGDDLRLRSVYMVSDAGGASFSFMMTCYRRFLRTAPIADLYYPLYLRQSVILNAPASVAKVYSMFRGLLSREITDVIKIYGRSEESAAKAHVQLAEDLNLECVPACYGGSLPCLTQDMIEELGYDDVEPALAAQFFQGSAANLGGFLARV